MKSVPVVIAGAGGHALVVADILQLTKLYRIAGFLDEISPQRRAEPHGPARILGGLDELPHLFANGVRHAIVAIGHNASRIRIAGTLTNAGFELISAIHPSSVISSSAKIGAGCVVAAQATICAETVVANNVIVNTGSTIDHECKIEAGVHICPGCHLAGRVHVGYGSWIGIGSTLIDRISIGAEAYIGAGSLVLSDVPASMLAYGVPAQIIRKTLS